MSGSLAARSSTPDRLESGLSGRLGWLSASSAYAPSLAPERLESGRGGLSAIRAVGRVGDPDWPMKLLPTESERRSCAGMGPRIRAMQIAEARKDRGSYSGLLSFPRCSYCAALLSAPASCWSRISTLARSAGSIVSAREREREREREKRGDERGPSPSLSLSLHFKF